MKSTALAVDTKSFTTLGIANQISRVGGQLNNRWMIFCTVQSHPELKCVTHDNDEHTPLHIRAIERLVSILCLCMLRDWRIISQKQHIMWDHPATDTVFRCMVCLRVAVLHRSDDEPFISRHCIRSGAKIIGQTKGQHEHNSSHTMAENRMMR